MPINLSTEHFSPYITVLKTRGETYRNLEVVRGQIHGAEFDVHRENVDTLDLREATALTLGAMGLTQKLTGLTLLKSEDTVKTQRSSAFRKIEVSGRGAMAHATAKMLDLDMIFFDDDKPLTRRALAVPDENFMSYAEGLAAGKMSKQIGDEKGWDKDWIDYHLRPQINELGLETHAAIVLFAAGVKLFR